MPAGSEPVLAAPDGAGSWIRLKVVPGASRTGLAGRHGDRYRLRVAAPPEGGKANRAVVDLLAGALDLPRASVRVVKGRTSPLKTVAVDGLSPAEVTSRLP